MYAIIETGGKQYKVAEGDKIKIEKLKVEEGSEITFDQVLTVMTDDGIKIGTPVVAGAKVVGEVLAQGKGKKVVVVHYKAKKNIHTKNGHRQPFTEILVKSIAI
ncbi:MAG: 50S ribosomal protein L21 [Clostridiales bacterium]